MKILIVEDDFIIQIFIKRTLTNLGHEIIGHTSNSDEVINLINNLSPDLILMDVSIDGSNNGIETTKIINEKYNIPIVYITGNSDTKTMAEVKKTNPLHIIKKPVDEEGLIEHFNLIKEKYYNLKRS